MRRYKVKKKRYKWSLLITLGIILILAMLAQLTFLSIWGIRGKEVANIRREQKKLILENELLVADINKMQSLVRIREIATEELGMVDVGDLEYITAKDTLSSRDLQEN